MSDSPDSTGRLEVLKQAFLEIKELQARLSAAERARSEPIAIIGMACRFPGDADSPEAFWRLLADGVDTVTEVPPERWDVDAFYDPDPTAPGKMSTRWGSFLRGVDQFDPYFFGISPREATYMDPQERLLLEVSYEALERAGQTAGALAGSRTGVFIGIYNSDYSLMKFADREQIDAYSGAGANYSITANRLSYQLNLQGPNIALDTACSSSLVATHLAVQSLRSGECELALAGAVNLILTPDVTISFSKWGMMAPDGRCKTFDARANGFVRGEGCGVLVLKRLSDAQRDGDNILAVVRGSAVNQDGRTNGFTVPNGLAQQAVIRQALDQAGVAPEQVGLIEAHGSGTSLGDPIEVEALSAVYGRPRASGLPCALGSVKTNLGHLEAAAGMAGIIKAVLALQHAAIPPHLHFRSLNPSIVLDGTPFVIPTAPRPWPAGDAPRAAAVSSFGVGGTNAHLILEEPPARPPAAAPAPETPLLLPLSARSDAALRQLAARYAAALAAPDAPPAPALVAAAATRRAHRDERLALLAPDAPALRAALTTVAAGTLPPGAWRGSAPLAARPGLVFVCPGQGGQWPGMARDLLALPPVAQAVAACDAALVPHLGWSVQAELAAPPHQQRLDDIAVVQPLLFTLQLALAALWQHWGVRPDALVGHSMGEVAAAVLAGALPLAHAAQVIARRSALLRQVRGQGAMALVELDVAQAHAALGAEADQVAVAVSNGPRATVLAGAAEALAAVLDRLTAQGVFCRSIKVDVASHSPQMDGLLPALAQELVGVRGQMATLPIYSTVTGARLAGPELDGAYWGRNLRAPVQFWGAVQQLVGDGYTWFVELSAHPTLTGALADGLAALGADGVVVGTLRREAAGLDGLGAGLGTLYAAGYDVDWRAGYGAARAVPLPTYPWQRERFWLDDAAAARNRRHVAGGHPLLGAGWTSSTQPGTHFWEQQLDQSTLPFLRDHRVRGLVVLPAAGYVEMALAAGAQVFGPATPLALEGLALRQALALPAEGSQTVQLVLTADGAGGASVQVASRPDGQEGWTLHATARLRQLAAPEAPPAHDPPAAITRRCTETLTPDALYDRLEAHGLSYGPAFRGVTQLWRRDGEALGRLKLPDAARARAGSFALHPVLFDAAAHLLSAALPRAALEQAGGTYLPVAIGQLRAAARPSGDLWGHVVVRPGDADDGTAFDGDLFLIDDAGTVVLEAHGLRARLLHDDAPSGAGGIDEWLYQLAWQPQALPAQDQPDDGPAGGWLLLADRRGIAEGLAAQLAARGAAVTLALPGPDYRHLTDAADGARDGAARRYQIDPLSPGDFARLLQDAFAGGPACRGVVHLWSVDAAPTAALTPDALEQAQALGCYSALHLIQALSQAGWRSAPRLWLVTAGAQPVQLDQDGLAVAQSPLWGLGRAVALEQPRLACTRIDLGHAATGEERAALWAEIWAAGREDQIALRGADRYVARLARYAPPDDGAPSQLIPAGDRPFRLEQAGAGILDNLRLHEAARRAPGPGEVEIEVRAAGLNFSDVMKAMGVYPSLGEGPLLIGGECAGVVTAVGAGVGGLEVGDAVLAVAPFSFASFVTADAGQVVPKPPQLSFEQAAGLPIVWMTAYYALDHLAQLAPGERVLIHSAAGGVGLAALQVARRAGAEIFATAGSEEKRAYLRSLGVAHVYDSRTLDFADAIMADTGGTGVDVVLNSLPGEAVARGLAILREHGRFVEIGKKDIYENRPVGLLPFRNNLSLFAVDLERAFRARPALCGRLLREVVGLFAEGAFQPLPVETFPVSQAVAAFRHMAQARHIGKIAVALRDPAAQLVPGRPAEAGFRADGSYLITGGLTGLGLAVAEWMVTNGARHLLLLGRRAPGPAAQAVLATLEQAGARVLVAQADVTDRRQLAAALELAARELPPLRGVVHSAGLLDNGVLAHQSRERFRAVMAPKLDGAWHLHQLTAGQPLDFFVLFSSVAALFGAPGQANHAAANAFLDALAHHRRAKGLPALSINWGPWAEIGVAAGEVGAGLETRGFASLTPAQGLATLGHLLGQGAAQVGAVAFNIRQWRQMFPKAAELPMLSDLVAAGGPLDAGGARLRDQLLGLGGPERRALLERTVRDQIAQVLRLEPDRISARTPLGSLGFDSLLSLELRNRLEGACGLTLPATLTWTYPTVAALAAHLAQKLDLALDDDDHAPDQAAPAEAGPVDSAALLQEVDQLSDEDALRLLSGG